MINRELIRLKVVQLIYAYYQNEGKPLDVAVKELDFSLLKAYELYKHLLTFLIELREMAERHDNARLAREQRSGVKAEGISAAHQLATNKFLVQLSENLALNEFREKRMQEWNGEEGLIKRLYTSFVEHELFENYLKREDFSYEADREIIRKLYKILIVQNEDFNTLLEEQSLYWNDDKEVVDSFVIKTIKRFDEEKGAGQELLPEYDNEEDHKFAIELFTSTIQRKEEIRQLIRENSKNWEISRMALMDIIIAQVALTEILVFPTIPINVSLNEYLNIAKVYSTPKSASYLNGMLDHIVKQLKEENRLLK